MHTDRTWHPTVKTISSGKKILSKSEMMPWASDGYGATFKFSSWCFHCLIMENGVWGRERWSDMQPKAHCYLFIFYRWCHKQGFCPCSSLSPINKYVQICWVYKIVEKIFVTKDTHFFPIHNFIPSLVEPKTLFSDVQRGVPSFSTGNSDSSVSWY